MEYLIIDKQGQNLSELIRGQFVEEKNPGNMRCNVFHLTSNYL